jgi:hypothetical protein
MSAELGVKRTRFTTVERELSQLGKQHDIAMSAFKFDKARDLQRRIAALERERAELMAVLPTAAPPPPEAPVRVRVGRRPLGRNRRGLPGPLSRPLPPQRP